MHRSVYIEVHNKVLKIMQRENGRHQHRWYVGGNCMITVDGGSQRQGKAN